MVRQMPCEALPASVVLNNAATRQCRLGARGVLGCVSIFVDRNVLLAEEDS